MARNNRNLSEDQRSTTGMTWSDLIKWTTVNISWKLVGAGIIFSLVLIPILYLYRWIFPELFLPRAPTYSDSIVLLPASQMWMQTGIEVQEGEEIQIRASGGVNLATHRLVWSALSDTKPSLPWMFLPGQSATDSIGPRPDDGSLHPNAPDGSLLMFIRPLNAVPSSDNPRPSSNPNDDYSVVAPRSASEWVPIKARRGGELCFAVDDVVADAEKFYVSNDPKSYRNRVDALNKISLLFRSNAQENTEMTTEKSREVGEYLGRFVGRPPATPEEYIERKRQHWRRLNDSGYKRIFHDDNSGSYLITIRKRVP